jgi:hypothetical protein
MAGGKFQVPRAVWYLGKPLNPGPAHDVILQSQQLQTGTNWKHL